MHSQIYRGVFHSKDSVASFKIIKNLKYAYRGILYLKSMVKKKDKHILNMHYRGVSYKKFESE
jgi:hypothetical protein